MTENILETELFYQFKEEDLKLKEEKLRLLLLETPDNIQLLKKLAIVLYHKGDYETSIKLFRKVVESGKNGAQAYAFLGQLYYENEEFLKAIECFNKSLKLDPDEAFVHFLLGNAYSRAGKIMEAIMSYDFAIFLDLDIYKAHLDFAEKYERMGLLERALKEYIIAYEIDPREKKVAEKIRVMKEKVEEKVG